MLSSRAPQDSWISDPGLLSLSPPRLLGSELALCASPQDSLDPYTVRPKTPGIQDCSPRAQQDFLNLGLLSKRPPRLHEVWIWACTARPKTPGTRACSLRALPKIPCFQAYSPRVPKTPWTWACTVRPKTPRIRILPRLPGSGLALCVSPPRSPWTLGLLSKRPQDSLFPGLLSMSTPRFPGSGLALRAPRLLESGF